MEQNQIATVSRNELIELKIDACWCINKRAHGIANMHKIAEYLYSSLYQPDDPEVPLVEYFPGCIMRFQQRLPLSVVPPPKEVFIETIKRVMVYDIDYGACLYDNSLVNFQKLFRYGRVMIWTSGDMYGFPEKNIPGSKQQLHKIKAAGVEAAAREVAVQEGRPLSQLFSIVAYEDKLVLLSKIFHDMRKRGTRMVVIMDDQLANLLCAREAAAKANLKVILCWVSAADANKEVLSKHVVTVRNFDTAINYVTNLNVSLPCEFLVDFDGVIFDDERRSAFHKQAIIDNLKQNNWI